MENPYFANIKNNHHFKRFMLRTKPKVDIEVGLLPGTQSSQKSSLKEGFFSHLFLTKTNMAVQQITSLSRVVLEEQNLQKEKAASNYETASLKKILKD
jgi:hypothetical protein